MGTNGFLFWSLKFHITELWLSLKLFVFILNLCVSMSVCVWGGVGAHSACVQVRGQLRVFILTVHQVLSCIHQVAYRQLWLELPGSLLPRLLPLLVPLGF